MPDLTAAGLRVLAPPAPPELFETAFYDTSDLRLARWGSTLTFRPGEGWAVELPDVDGGPGIERRVIAGSGDTIPADAMALVRSFGRGAPISAVARLRTSRRGLRVADFTGAPLADVSEDAVTVYRGAGPAAGFRELEIRFHQAVAADRRAGLAELLRSGAVAVPATRLVRALGPAAMQPPDVAAVEAGRDATAGELLESGLSAAVRRFVLHAPIAVIGTDPEGVHQARVALRRIRALLQTFRPVLVEDWSEPFRADLRLPAGVFGEVRDADVLIDRLRGMQALLPEGDAAMVDKIIMHRLGERHVARARLLHFLDQPEYLSLLDRLVEATTEPQLGPEAAQPAAEVLVPLVARRWKRLRRSVKAMDDPPTDEQLHEVRLQAKRTRYTAETVRPVVGEAAAEFAAAAAALQDVLGAHQDAVVGQQWLRGQFGAADPDLRFVVGELGGLELAGAARSRAEWPEVWKRLSKKKRRRWLK